MITEDPDTACAVCGKLMMEHSGQCDDSQLRRRVVTARMVTFLLPEEKVALSEAAQDECRSMSGLIRQMIREGLERRGANPNAR